MIENLNFSLAFFHIPVETPFIGYFTPRAHFCGQQTKETKDYLRKFIPLLGHASSPSLAILCSRQLFSTRRACTHALECRSHWTRNRLWTRLEDRESSGDNRPDALSARVLSRCNGVKDPRRGRFGSSKFQVHVPRLPPRSTTTTAIVAAITDPTTTTIAEWRTSVVVVVVNIRVARYHRCALSNCHSAREKLFSPCLFPKDRYAPPFAPLDPLYF